MYVSARFLNELPKLNLHKFLNFVLVNNDSFCKKRLQIDTGAVFIENIV